jgi:hypothetical protein
MPGITEIDCQFTKKFDQHMEFCISIQFANKHRAHWARHSNGDYYASNGVYLDNIYLDQRDITLWGFNQLVTQHLVSSTDLPTDYADHINRRCVAQDTDLRWTVEAGVGMHAHLLRILQPEFTQEYQYARRRLMRALESHA